MPRGTANEAVGTGECASSLSDKAGQFWEEVWKRSENKSLRDSRTDAHILMEGDRLFIPPIEPKKRDCVTDVHHTFRLKGVPEKLRIRLLWGDEPRANEPYLLRFQGEEKEEDREGVTDPDGKLEEWIPPGTMSAVLFLQDDEFDLDLGQLYPPNTTEGAIARLVNLGLLPQGWELSELDFRTALGAFQHNRKITVTHGLDDATARALDTCYKEWPGGVTYGG